jgi:HlyD family secretion protein
MKPKKLLRYLIIAVVLLIILAVVGKRAGWFGKNTVYRVSTEKPLPRTIIETITANGKVQPETEVKLSPDVSGEIVELNIIDGQEVKKGDLLLKIKPDIYISTLERMEASVNTAKANLSNAEAQLEQVKAQFTQTEASYTRNKKLYDQGAISQSEYETAVSAYEMGKANVDAAKQSVKSAEFTVKSAEASLQEANENLTKTSIYAPMDGTISKLNVENGERVVGTVQMAGTELLRIANLNVMEVLVQVNENDIVRVKLGDTALIEVDAYIGQKFKGMVTEIANSANTTGVTTDQVTSFDVKIRILPESYQQLLTKDKPNRYPFRPGMSATVDIQTHTCKNTLSVPIQAVTARIDSSKFKNKQLKKEKTTEEPVQEEKIEEMVFVFSEGKVYMKKVKTGIQDNNYIQIISGIEINDEVVVAPYTAISKKLKDKMDVTKVDKDQLFLEKGD